MRESKSYWSHWAARVGTPYLIYPTLYTTVLQGFHASGSFMQRRSVRGCYQLLLDLLIKKRRSSSSLHTIPQTKLSISTNIFPDHLIHNSMRGSTERLERHDAKGKKMKVFIEVCCFFSDYSASLRNKELWKLSAWDPCTHCVIIHCNKENYFVFVDTTSVHNNNCPFSKSINRIIELWGQSLKKADYGFLDGW